jgi:hypothetical protein
MDLGGINDRGPFRRAALKQYIGLMSNPNNHALVDPNVAQLLIEQGIHWEDDPRSVYDPSQLWDALALYGPKNHVRLQHDPAIKAGIALAWKVFGRHEEQDLLTILSEIEVLGALHLEKNSGLPLLIKKGEAYTYASDREHQIRKGDKSPNPCVAFKRTQANNKTRLVWGFPLEMTIMESRFARPLIEQFLSSRTTMAFGLMKHELGTYLEYYVNQSNHVLSLDYSKFDSSISASLIQASFSILASWFDEEDRKEYGWDQIIKYFICTPIVMPDGHLYTGKDHGVPSGSYFTQLIDSIVNTMLIGAFGYAFKEKTHWRSFFVLGDDCILGVERDHELSKIASFFSHYGIKLNTLKSGKDALEFLGAIWSILPDQDVSVLASKAVQPETFRRYPESFSKRQRGMTVLSAYAGQYRSAHKLFGMLHPIQVNGMVQEYYRRDFLTGSDKYLTESVEETRPKERYVPGGAVITILR